MWCFAGWFASTRSGSFASLRMTNRAQEEYGMTGGVRDDGGELRLDDFALQAG
jgi:hypothetical protein